MWSTRSWAGFHAERLHVEANDSLLLLCVLFAKRDDLPKHIRVEGFLEARAYWLVIMPEGKGAGVSIRFLNVVCSEWRWGRNRYGIPMPTLFHNSHPGLAAALRGDPKWAQVSAGLVGDNKLRCAASIAKSAGQKPSGSGYGGHFRAVQGFHYMGEPAGAS